MANSTALYSNMTQVSVYSNKTIEIIGIVLVILLVLCFCFFLYLIIIILCVYFTTAHVRENARYVLFAHMLVNDTMYLILGMFLWVGSLYVIYFPVVICYVLVTVSSTSFKTTPYNLAVMALERYVAICYPLRHAQLCTPQRSHVAIAIIWAVGLIPNVADLIALSSSVETKYFSLNVICSRATFIKTPVQNTMRSLTHIITFTLVGLIIVYTYIRIMLIARKISSGKSSAFKAGKTVMLHAFQLLLCMTAFSYPITEAYLKNYISLLATLNFLLFMCLPRFLSPLIYGIRDEVFRVYIKRYILCNTLKIDPQAAL
ncbi:odorant receptor 131-2-like [Ascaphus truei]|uniref:odorant receptor 131-2-like n=1 Tax=Ascaphus truei TaxID=8439 RepID=UPI003F5AB2BB